MQKYHGMLLSLQRRVGRGISITGNYTWSHCQGNYVDINQNGPPANETYSKPGDRNFDNGNCNSDRRQIFNATAVAQTPKFANRTLNMLASGWRITGIYHFTSGKPINVLSGFDQALNGVQSQRAQQILQNPYGDKSGRPLTNFLNPAAFAQPALGTLGNVGRNSIQGPSTWQLDMGLSRSFQVREGDARQAERSLIEDVPRLPHR